MSDAAIYQICFSMVTIVGMIVGYLKLKNGLQENTTQTNKIASNLALHSVRMDNKVDRIAATTAATHADVKEIKAESTN